MKFIVNETPSTIRFPLIPLLDVMLLMLMVFMLNLRVIYTDGRGVVNLPGAAPDVRSAPIGSASEIKVALHSDERGRLEQITLGTKNLGNDDVAFERLSSEIERICGRHGRPMPGDIEVELNADFETRHEHVVKAISACTGRTDSQTQQVVRFVDKIKFAPPRKPGV